ncbi:membrane dipeptidase [Shewanella litorisediminis]|uniref:Membrane dipeptidase n=1 Tax=Shewanella litorisediminis TaxID=1173586 RepID=A0ABX7G172_9GAMM|nr:membrane dipeptidase [Shewanella litorisediminis]MCL2918972.1 dipeptidase [Shewanella litorisediminis]QRH01039.1 membrane dipeptidase [Shewanella litorisediminis]
MTNLHRRSLIKALGASALLSALPPGVLAAKALRPLYIDGLSFLPDSLDDLAASGLSAFLCDISAIEEVKQEDGTLNYKRTYNACIKSIAEAGQRVRDNPRQLLQGLSAKDIQSARESGRTAVFFQIQGADCVEERLSQVDEFYQKGLRVLQLTHHYGNSFAGGALDSDERGGLNLPLSPKGYALVDKLNDSGILIDLSHSSPQTALDTIAASRMPVVQSHGAARAIVNHARCSPDQVIRAIANSGGVFGVFMMSFWLTTNSTPRVEHYLAQLKHVANVGGMDAVAIANDYPLRGQENLLKLNNDNAEGVKEFLDWWHSLRAKKVLGFDHEPVHVVIPEFNHIERMSRIHDALKGAGFSAADADKIMGGNWQRVLHQVLV